MATMMLMLINYNNAKSLLKFIGFITANSWSLLYLHNFSPRHSKAAPFLQLC